MYGALHLFGLERLAGNDEMEVDGGKDFRIRRCTLRSDFNDAIGDRRATPSQDVHYVVSRAAASADQNRFHRTRAKGAPAAFGRAVHDDRMTALGFTDEGDVLDPLDASF